MPRERLLITSLDLPYPPAEVFPFFADAANLDAITPPHLRFRILTPPPIRMQVGTLIDYSIRLRGVPMGWRTRISAWDPPHRFVDEQIRGPYALWVHEHTFEPTPTGTRCRDVVRYAHHGGPLVERLLVRPDIERIFAFRNAALARRFAAPPITLGPAPLTASMAAPLAAAPQPGV
ncbi:MAG: SRPBCC family protein [Planctomycetota bacterium]|nr:SRPBCC family protein [Planctomycetota bacterium]